MKKIVLLLTFSIIFVLGASANTVGVLGQFQSQGFSATASFSKVEVELSVTDLTSGVLSLSADYNIVNNGIVENLFWNFGAGAALGVSDGGLSLGIIAPVELVYNIKPILNGMDIYLQATPYLGIISSFKFDFDIGLGVRFAY